MSPDRSSVTLSRNQRPKRLALPLVCLLCCAGVLLTHGTLLHLPYFWDEGGYYVPAALDFFHSGTLIPVFTNAHPPLPSVVLGSLWHLFGFHILVTRITACVFAGLGLAAVYRLAEAFLPRMAALVTLLLTAVYPIWFAQSSLAHADIFAAAFTLAALAVYLPSVSVIGKDRESLNTFWRPALASLLFCGSVLAKETAVVQPVVLGVLEAALAVYVWQRQQRKPQRATAGHARWAAALLLPVPVLALWFLYHYARTGFIFGNPEFLRYNATGNLTLSHVLYALRIRFVHLFWQRDMWVPLVLAGGALLLPRQDEAPASRNARFGIADPVAMRIGLLVIANLVAFSVLGGALLTRYLLPMYPLILLVCVATWRSRIEAWPWLGALTGLAFCCALWLNPWTFFAPEDNLTYRNMIVVQQHAIAFLNAHYPQATVLTAWPVAADLTRPELGYTSQTFRVHTLENFTPPELLRAAQDPGDFDTALVFTTHYISPSFRRSLLLHPRSWRGRRYSNDLDLTPVQIAARLGGRVVWQEDLDGEWAAILRFPRSYEARLLRDTCIFPCVPLLTDFSSHPADGPSSVTSVLPSSRAVLPRP